MSLTGIVKYNGIEVKRLYGTALRLHLESEALKYLGPDEFSAHVDKTVKEHTEQPIIFDYKGRDSYKPDINTPISEIDKNFQICITR